MHHFEAQSMKPFPTIQTSYPSRQPHFTYQQDQFFQQGQQMQYEHLRNNNNNNNNNTHMREGSSGRRRPSRGNRCVNTLTEAQLERKRANDREAQRAIRQRTKEQIENLQKRVAELSVHERACDELAATAQRNKELEEENLLLRSKLNQAMDTLRRSDGADPVLSPPISISGDMYNSNQQDPSLRNFYQQRSSSTSTVASVSSATAAAALTQVPSSNRPGPNGWNLSPFQNQLPSTNPSLDNNNYSSRFSPSPKSIASGKNQDMSGFSWGTTQDANRSQSLSDIYNAAAQGNHVGYWTGNRGQQAAEYPVSTVVTTTGDQPVLYETSQASGGRVLAPETVSSTTYLTAAVPTSYNQCSPQQQQQQQQKTSPKDQARHPRNDSAGAVQAIGSYDMLNGCESYRPTTTISLPSLSSTQLGVSPSGAMPVGGLSSRQYMYDMAVQSQD